MQRGLLAEFDSPGACTRAIRSLKNGGLRQLDVYMPYPAKDVHEALETPPSPLPRFVFAAGLLGAGLAYFIIWYTSVVDYPLNVGGRPDHAVPAFIPITFETLVLFAGFAAFVGALLLGGLPRLYHPVDEVGIEPSSVDRFILCVDADDTGFDRVRTRSALTDLGALRVREMGDLDAEKPEAQP